jgi:capsule polysaccharide export protein KpsE/RkpR
MLEKLIEKFDLVKEYNRKTFDDVLEDAAGYISADENKEGAYEIKVRSVSPQKAADMANFLVEELNKTVIEMNVQKSKDNRQFLEKRYDEIKKNLRISEDSLTRFQKTSGILLAEEQTKASIEAYTKMEADLVSKQSEVAILKKIYGDDSPQIKNAVIALDEYNSKLENLKKGKENTDLLMAIKNLPANGMTYVRLFRDVTIYNKMLEFIIPLYEQTRFEEQKNIPVLQIVDHAKAPEKRAYPKRFVVTAIVVVIVFFLTLFSIILREVVVSSVNPKVLSLRKSLRLRG